MRDATRQSGINARPEPPGASAEERDALARLRRWGGDRLVREMAELYLGQMPERLAAARRAVSQRDAPALARAAHGMRSSSAQLGATALADACEATERAAAEGKDVDRAIANLARVQHEYDTFRQRLCSLAGIGSAATQHPAEHER